MVRKKYSKKEIAIAVSCAILTFSILTFYLWYQTEIIRIGYELGELEQNVLTLTEEVKKLEAKRSSLLALERVEKIAREELNLSEPKEEQIVDDDSLPPDKIKQNE